MGFFDFFRKDSDEKKEPVNETRELLAEDSAMIKRKIAKEISSDDKTVTEEIEKCIKDTEAYFKENQECFAERGIELDDVEEDVEQVRWLALASILEANEYVCERDWKDELEDFLYFVGNLKGRTSRSLPMEPEWFSEDGGVAEWCGVLDDKWADKGVCVAAIDIESDSYVLFPCEVEELDRLRDLAKQIERRIDFAKNM